jgi:hypothetical protein
MKRFLFLISVLFCAGSFAQEKKPVKKTEPAPPPSYVGKEWKINSLEEFSVLKKPSGKTLNDMLLLNADNTFKIRRDSVEIIGKYTRGGKAITLKTEDNKLFYLNVLQESPDSFKIKCLDPDYVTSFLLYTLK